MRQWMIIDNATGEEIAWPVEQDDEPQVEEGQTAIDQPPGYGTLWRWNAATRGRVDMETLDEARERLKREAETVRDAHIDAGCETPSGRVDCDLPSRVNISGAVAMASILGAQFTISWRMQNNEYETLDAAAMTAMGVAVGQHVAACYAASFAVKDAIDAAVNAASSSADIAEVDMRAGYP